jgi:hypothetical protein
MRAEVETAYDAAFTPVYFVAFLSATKPIKLKILPFPIRNQVPKMNSFQTFNPPFLF